MTETLTRDSRRSVALAVGAVLVAGVAIVAYLLLRPTGLSPELRAVHDATAEFQTVAAVEDAGYAELLDKDGIACIDHDDQGAMGVHYVHGDLVGDATVDPMRPEAVIYEPGPTGSMELIGVEYVVFQESWDAANDAPPALFGQAFTAVDADNRYGIPAFYELHAWVWRDNPAGRFADYNPDVTCAHAAGQAGAASDHDAASGDRHSGEAAHPPAGETSAPTRPPRLSGW